MRCGNLNRYKTLSHHKKCYNRQQCDCSARTRSGIQAMVRPLGYEFFKILDVRLLQGLGHKVHNVLIRKGLGPVFLTV